MEEEKFELEKRLQDVNFKYIQLQSQLNKGEAGETRTSDRLVNALANEKQAKAQLIKLEAVVAAYESRVSVIIISVINSMIFIT